MSSSPGGCTYWLCKPATCGHPCIFNTPFIPDEEQESEADPEAQYSDDDEMPDVWNQMINDPDPIRHGDDYEPPLPIILDEIEGCNQVINTLELRDMILKYLSPANIYELKRVNGSWRTAIEARNFKKALYRKPDLRDVEIPPVPELFAVPETPRFYNDAVFQLGDTGTWELPLFFLYDPLLMEEDHALYTSYITQPPSTSVTFRIVVEWASFDPRGNREWVQEAKSEFEISNARGVRVGNLVKRCMRFADRWVMPIGAVREVDVDRSRILVDDSVVPDDAVVPEWILGWRQRSRNAFEGRHQFDDGDDEIYDEEEDDDRMEE
ncbi:uncharacterized protein RCC_08745 [Ramularia collo-cygni]|uniref:F-box domain-containing protein n=1 Tax=Ramularia collo-cygni TaxID=112498 RepID=A0A2D3VBI9_9PEZI|nr:uncharacterized protein RCC_08745 [Ramularia collo-cygni]CZT23035.1 uncharacterized protein RCC_08745 [Ramularia collo-cygni]